MSWFHCNWVHGAPPTWSRLHFCFQATVTYMQELSDISPKKFNQCSSKKLQVAFKKKRGSSSIRESQHGSHTKYSPWKAVCDANKSRQQDSCIKMHQQVELEDNFLIHLVPSDKPIFYNGDKIAIMCMCRDDKIQLF